MRRREGREGIYEKSVIQIGNIEIWRHRERKEIGSERRANRDSV